MVYIGIQYNVKQKMNFKINYLNIAGIKSLKQSLKSIFKYFKSWLDKLKYENIFQLKLENKGKIIDC